MTLLTVRPQRDAQERPRNAAGAIGDARMSTKQGSGSAALRARLKHPVIDSDGHWVEFGPDLMDYLKEVGGSRAADGFRNRPYEGWHLTVPLKERRERRLDQPVWWGVPTP